MSELDDRLRQLSTRPIRGSLITEFARATPSSALHTVVVPSSDASPLTTTLLLLNDDTAWGAFSSAAGRFKKRHTTAQSSTMDVGYLRRHARTARSISCLAALDGSLPEDTVFTTSLFDSTSQICTTFVFTSKHFFSSSCCCSVLFSRQLKFND